MEFGYDMLNAKDQCEFKKQQGERVFHYLILVQQAYDHMIIFRGVQPGFEKV